MRRTTLLVAMALTIGACAKDKDIASDSSAAPAPPAVPFDVQTALAVQSGIARAPRKTDSVLTANRLTLTGLDSLMYRIAADSALRAAYAAAR